MNHLQADSGQIMVVGDNYQAIFGFRGSVPRIFFMFEEAYNHSQLRSTLTINYR